ncbi:MAG: OB-fold nucleic acid binding domain-containing protein [Methanobacteriota archaeon]
MQHTTTQLYERIKDLKTRKEFTTLIRTRSQQYDGLFDDNTIALLIVDELGRNTQSITPIAHMQPDTDCTIQGTIAAIHEPKTFQKKNGAKGKVINLDIRDATGSSRLVLWNEDADQLDRIHIGTTIKIINGYVKNGFNGIEINLGRWGALEIEPKHDTTKKIVNPEPNHTSEPPTSVTGVLTKREPTRAFFKDNGEFGFVTTITIKNPSNQEQQLTLWGENVKQIQHFKIGEPIHITGITQKQYNGKTELHLNGDSTIKRD